jgi:hypothetical protein
VSTAKGIYFWVDSITHSSVDYLSTEDFEKDIIENFNDIINYYAFEVNRYQRLVLDYMWTRYWKEQ